MRRLIDSGNVFSGSPSLAWLLGCFLLLSDCSYHQDAGPLSPEDSLESMHIQPEFRVELFAAEPDVVDPVEMAFDARGRIFVAEMLDLPYDPPVGESPRSRIRLLEDSNGDGQVDKSHIFADKLQQVTSVLPWKDGLLVTAAPDILYLKDTTGDGVANQRRVLFTGFTLVDPEARITNLRFGIDNWIYTSNNGRPGEITFMRNPRAPKISVQGADFRFRLDRNLFEPASGPAQFGIAMNDWGHRFITTNTVHVRHVVVPWRYLRRNPFLVAGPPALDISDHGTPAVPIFPLTTPQHWRQVRTRMRQQRYRDNQLDRVEHVGGYFSGAAGGTIYGGTLFPKPYWGNLFTGDVSANLVHRDELTPAGVSFVASRPLGEEKREFLASTDVWFRPCNFATGPDGALYIVDMYREFIETPESVPEELKKDINFYSGDTMGRIYRILPKTVSLSAGRRAVRLGGLTSEELVTYLADQNSWWRLTAQRLLLERQDQTVVPQLKEMALNHSSPQARLHALYSLEGLSALDAAWLGLMLEDVHPEVRVHAVRLSEAFPELLPQLVLMVDDPSLRVVFQLAFSLGEFSGPKVVNTLARLSQLHAENPWFRTALLSSEIGSSNTLLKALLKIPNFWDEATIEKSSFLKELAAVIGARNKFSELTAFLMEISQENFFEKESWLTASVKGLTRGLKVTGAPRQNIRGAQKVTHRLMGVSSLEAQEAARAMVIQFKLPGLFATAKQDALNPELPFLQRELAICSLPSHSFFDVRPVFERLLVTPLEPVLLTTALEALASFEDSSVPQFLVDHWQMFPVGARFRVLDILLDRQEHISILLDTLENGSIEVGALDWARKEKLLRNPDVRLATRARRLLGDTHQDRQRVVQNYLPVLDLSGKAEGGRAVFKKHCATCHFSKKGLRIGPDLSGVSSNTRAQLLQSILNPSKTIGGRYINYLVLTQDNHLLDGLIVNETSNSLTLRRPESGDITLLKATLTEVRASNVSLMPDGFEDGIDHKQMANLIAYLQGANLH